MISPAPARRRLLAAVVVAAIAAVAAVGVVWWTSADRPVPARVDKASEDAALAVIDAQLRTGWDGVRVPPTGKSEPGWVCTQLVVESHLRDGALQMGIVASCEQFVRSPDALVSRAGYSAVPMVVRLSPDADRYRIVALQQAEDGGGHAASVRRMFSEAGAAAVLDDGARPARPDTVARQAFGLPDGFPVR